MENLIIGINPWAVGSTGNIMRNSLEYAHFNGNFDYFILTPKRCNIPNSYPYSEFNKIIDKIDRRLIHRSLGNPDGLYEYRSTKRLIHIINHQCKKYKNIIIHLHNIHMAYIDFRLLFNFLAKKQIIKSVFYTIHDCWPFTGGCYYYSYMKCNKWKTGCMCECPQKYGSKHFPVSKIWDLKRKYTSLLKNKLTLLPVSDWINNEMDKSFLSSFNRIVINGETNVVNLGYKDEILLKKYMIQNKKIVLTVSSYWCDWKGDKYIYEVARRLPSEYIIMVVGGKIDNKGFNNIIYVGEVPNEELNHYYSVADVYMSLSQSESLGLTTCEAQICGVPVVAFGHTAIKETFTEKTGILVGEDNNVDEMVKAIIHVVENKPFYKEDIIDNGKRFCKYSTAKKYFELYKKCI